ncbi:hypothetical protein P4655_16395 [Priestia megaterium]
MSRHTFEDKLKAIDLYLNRNSYRETAKLMSAKSQASATTVAALSLKVV